MNEPSRQTVPAALKATRGIPHETAHETVTSTTSCVRFLHRYATSITRLHAQRDAARQHTEIMGSISQENAILEKKIDELHTFEREYRTHWKTRLQTQLRELDGHRSVTPADPMRTPQDLVTSGSGTRTETRS